MLRAAKNNDEKLQVVAERLKQQLNETLKAATAESSKQ
jgi:hypothetical protein